MSRPRRDDVIAQLRSLQPSLEDHDFSSTPTLPLTRQLTKLLRAAEIQKAS